MYSHVNHWKCSEHVSGTYLLSQDWGKPSDLQGSAVTRRLDPKSSEKSCVSEWLFSTDNSSPDISTIFFLNLLLISFSCRAIWNDLADTDTGCLDNQESITVNFSDDDTWEQWGEWVFKRCEVSSNEKLVMVLHKVCNISVHCLETQWAKTFYKQLSQLITCRIECCTEDDMCKKLKKFESILNFWQT